jgi:HD superfamily phosphohydrolase YqeK
VLPTKEISEIELSIAREMNPGPWIKHSINTGIAARNIADKVKGLDAEKAYILGVLHDIGRRVGVVSISTHVYEGYTYAMSKGWNEVGKICMTHSYPLMQKEFNFDPDNEVDIAIKEYIMDCKCDDYDLLIQLCDSLATDYGFCILEKRFVDVTRRYGIWENTIARWNVTFEIKEYFEKRIGCSIYELLPNIGNTTLMSPPPWNPPSATT